MLLNTLQCTGRPSQRRILWYGMSVVPRLRNSSRRKGISVITKEPVRCVPKHSGSNVLLVLHVGPQAPEPSFLSHTSSQACVPGNRALSAGVTRSSAGSPAPPYFPVSPWASQFPSLNLSFISAVLHEHQGLQKKRENIFMYPWLTVWQTPTYLTGLMQWNEIMPIRCFAQWQHLLSARPMLAALMIMNNAPRHPMEVPPRPCPSYLPGF